MTQDNSQHRIEEDRQREREEDKALRGAAAMRMIVPLQGVLQGRAGVVLGTVIPCALFYFLQLYFRRHRPPPRPPSSVEPAVPKSAPMRTQPSLKSPSRPPFVSSSAAGVAEGDDSPYYAGWREYLRNPYDAERNPDGVIQLGFAENQLSLDLIEDWLTSHPEASLWEEIGDSALSLREIARYQPHHGMLAMKTESPF